ncbi:hypothetical protein cyc_00781 [Cyclospora cayetanensis]|uniref:Uncharacterized protein n=1 Tax=Cyclospora cayetanensis TaxID=88456 RepID=A0A1D3CV41_9EIME|nr:hypothetical protein cyc_00781 [Cyclospora cayetanensis]
MRVRRSGSTGAEGQALPPYAFGSSFLHRRNTHQQSSFFMASPDSGLTGATYRPITAAECTVGDAGWGTTPDKVPLPEQSDLHLQARLAGGDKAKIRAYGQGLPREPQNVPPPRKCVLQQVFLWRAEEALPDVENELHVAWEEAADARGLSLGEWRGRVECNAENMLSPLPLIRQREAMGDADGEASASGELLSDTDELCPVLASAVDLKIAKDEKDNVLEGQQRTATYLRLEGFLDPREQRTVSRSQAMSPPLQPPPALSQRPAASLPSVSPSLSYRAPERKTSIKAASIKIAPETPEEPPAQVGPSGEQLEDSGALKMTDAAASMVVLPIVPTDDGRGPESDGCTVPEEQLRGSEEDAPLEANAVIETKKIIHKWTKVAIRIVQYRRLYYKFAHAFQLGAVTTRTYCVVFHDGEDLDYISLLASHRTEIARPQNDSEFPKSRINCNFKQTVVLPFDVSSPVLRIAVLLVMAKKGHNGEPGEFMRRVAGITKPLSVEQCRERMSKTSAWPLYVPQQVIGATATPDPQIVGVIFFTLSGYTGGEGPKLSAEVVHSPSFDFRAGRPPATPEKESEPPQKMAWYEYLNPFKALRPQSAAQKKAAVSLEVQDSLARIPLPPKHKEAYLHLLSPAKPAANERPQIELHRTKTEVPVHKKQSFDQSSLLPPSGKARPKGKDMTKHKAPSASPSPTAKESRAPEETHLTALPKDNTGKATSKAPPKVAAASTAARDVGPAPAASLGMATKFMAASKEPVRSIGAASSVQSAAGKAPSTSSGDPQAGALDQRSSAAHKEVSGVLHNQTPLTASAKPKPGGPSLSKSSIPSNIGGSVGGNATAKTPAAESAVPKVGALQGNVLQAKGKASVADAPSKKGERILTKGLMAQSAARKEASASQSKAAQPSPKDSRRGGGI